ncbi:MAG: radical SAM protein, partial [Candidatus Woesearchaeota archaeon]|nr:radical SAM protein [Candidatus Woesearchaeota archaeon]
GYNVKTIGLNAQCSKEKLQHFLQENPSKLIGITCITEEIPYVKELSALIKSWGNYTIILGGPAAYSYTDLLSCKNIDFVIIGEGEETLRELLDFLIKKRGRLERIDGLAFKRNRRIILNSPRPPIRDLNSLPFPERNGLGTYETVLTARGCIYRCKFCLWHKAQGQGMREISPKLVAEEIKKLERQGVDNLYLASSILDVRDRYIEDLAALIIGKRRDLTSPEHIKAQCYLSSRKISMKTYNNLKRIGVDRTFYGMESASKKLRVTCGKNSSLTGIFDSIKKSRKAGITPVVSLMIGMPGENERTIKENLKIIDLLSRKKCVIPIFSFKPFPGTEIYNNISAYDIKIIDPDFTHWNEDFICVETSSLSAERMSSEIWAMRKMVYQRVKQYSIVNSLPFEFWNFTFLFLTKFHSIVKKILRLPKNRITLFKGSYTSQDMDKKRFFEEFHA